MLMVARFELADKGLLLPDGRVVRSEPSSFSAFSPHPNFVRSAYKRIYG